MISTSQYFLGIALISFGMFFFGARFGLWLGRENMEEDKLDRKRQKLMTTQRNIAGRIGNALREGLLANLQWGYRMSVIEKVEDSETIITVSDYGSTPAPTITKITVICDFKEMVAKIFTSEPSRMQSTDPNDPELTVLIGKQLGLLQNWSPSDKVLGR